MSSLQSNSTQASAPTSGPVVKKGPFHKHPMRFCTESKEAGEAYASGFNCDGCRGSALPFYHCDECGNVDLCKTCFEQKAEFKMYDRITVARTFQDPLTKNIIEEGEVITFLTEAGDGCRVMNKDKKIVLGVPMDCLIPRNHALSVVASEWTRIDPSDLKVQDETLGKDNISIIKKGAWKGFEVAVKIIDLSSDEKLPKGTEVELGVLASFHHPNITRLYGGCVGDSVGVIVLEHVPGQSLAEIFGSGVQMSKLHKAQVSLDVANAIKEFQSKNAHPFLKPEHVLVNTKEGTAKICCTDLLGMLDGAKDMVESLVYGGMILKGVTPNDKDMNAFGVLLNSIWAGAKPWAGQDTMSQLQAVLVTLGLPPLDPACPPEIADLIQRCWGQKGPRPSINDVVAPLKAFAEEAAEEERIRKEKEAEEERKKREEYEERVRKMREIGWTKIVVEDIVETGRILGTGAFGVVFEGVWQGINVAVKRLMNMSLMEQENLSKELRAMSELNHPNIVHVWGGNIADRDSVIVMEIVNGGTLGGLLAKTGEEALDLPRKVQLAKGVARGLAEVHQKMMHRDVKPENVLVDCYAWIPKISDFGLARSSDTGVSMHSLVAGTPAYMAPEILSYKPFDKSCDVYSFGVMLNEMFTGKKPWLGCSDFIQQVVSGKRPDIDPSTPAVIVKIIQDCWAQNPAVRPTFNQVVKMFDNAEAQFFGPPPAASAPAGGAGLLLLDPSGLQTISPQSLLVDSSQRTVYGGVSAAGASDGLKTVSPQSLLVDASQATMYGGVSLGDNASGQPQTGASLLLAPAQPTGAGLLVFDNQQTIAGVLSGGVAPSDAPTEKVALVPQYVTAASSKSVGAWLEANGLAECCSVFEKLKLDDYSVMSEVTEEDLKEEGVAFGHRKKIMKLFANLKQELN